MPQSPVRTHFDVALDIHRDFLTQVALDSAFLFQDLADAVDFVFAQIANLLIEINAGPVQQRPRTRAADAINVSEADLGSLLGRQIHSGDTCHIYPCLCLCFGFTQMTRTTPSRWITLHLSQNFFTDARTFMISRFPSTGQRLAHGRVSTHGPFEVTATQCSKCAE